MEGTEKLISTSLEFDVKVKAIGKEKGELIDVIAAGAKLTKADAGRDCDTFEDGIDIAIDPNTNDFFTPKVTISTHSKCTMIEAKRI